MKLFFSYGHDENSTIVQRIKEDVMREKHEVWVDVDRLQSGNDWRRKIAEGIMDSEMFFSFASSHALRNSGVCRDELSIAVAVKGALIQSVLLEKDVEVPANASYRQYIDMSDWKALYGTDAFEPWYQSKLAEILKIINDPETKKYEEEVRTLKNILRPNLSIAYKNSKEDALYCGRGWLKKMTDAWLQDSARRRILLLTGSPGSGKSAFVSHEFIFNAMSGAVIYCQWDNSESNNADAVIRALIFQLASHYPDYRYRLLDVIRRMEEDGRTVRNCEAEELYHSLFVRPMRELITGDRDTLLILIDGIDEIERQSRSGIRYAWKNELAELIEKSAGELPYWIRFFITSRKDTKVTRFLKTFESIDLDAYVQHNREDVDEYIALRLRDKMPEETIQVIQDKCEDNFQYAVLLTDGLLNGQIPLSDIRSLPASLTGLYYAYFSRTFPDRHVYADLYMPVFAAVCVSDEPIPTETVWKACGWKPIEKQEFRSATSSYFPREDIFQVFHLSLIDWLCSEEAYEFEIDRRTGIDLIRDGCKEAYLDNPQEMNRYELLHLIEYLKKTRDPLTKEVLQDMEFGIMLKEYAVSAMEEFRFADALKLARDSWEILQHGLPEEAENSIEAILTAVNALLRLSRKEDAEALCRSSERILEKQAPQCRNMSTLYSRHGKVSSMCNNWKESDAAYHRAETILQEEHDLYAAANVMNEHALMFRIASRFEDAEQMYEDIYKMIPAEQMKRESPALYVNMLGGRAFCAQSMAQTENARRLLEECTQILDVHPNLLNDSDASQIWYMRSFNAFADGRYQECLEFIERSLILRKKLYGSDSVEICSHLHEKGHALLKLGRKKEAEEVFRKSLAIRQSFYGNNNVYTAYSLRNLAKALCEFDDEKAVKEAILHLQDALRLFEEYNGEVSANAAMVCRDLAEAYIRLSQYDKARECVEKASDLYGQCQVVRGLAHCAKTSGDIAAGEGKKEEAKECWMKALQLYRESGLREEHSHIQETKAALNALQDA